MECLQARRGVTEAVSGATNFVPELVTHLTNCEDCRKYESEIRQLDRRLSHLPRVLPRFSSFVNERKPRKGEF